MCANLYYNYINITFSFSFHLISTDSTMHFRSQLLYKITFGTFLMLWAHSTAADMLRDGGKFSQEQNFTEYKIV